MLKCNYYGCLEASETFLKHLRPGGRLINVASQLGAIRRYPEELQNAFRSAAQQASPEASTKLMHNFAEAVANDSMSEQGWPRSAYSVSKAGCIAMTKALANAERQNARGVLINACCPGYIKTDLTKNRGVRSPDQGAQTPVLLALGDIQGSTGEFWKDERKSDW